MTDMRTEAEDVITETLRFQQLTDLPRAAARLIARDLELAGLLATDGANEAIRLIVEYGSTDGGHHKQWVLDQVLRALTGGARRLADPGITP